jgi:hypothetical protein
MLQGFLSLLVFCFQNGGAKEWKFCQRQLISIARGLQLRGFVEGSLGKNE